MVAPLILIMAIVWTPQMLLTNLALAGRSIGVESWTFVLGAPSLKFYALLGTFALGLAAYRIEGAAKPELVYESSEGTAVTAGQSAK